MYKNFLLRRHIYTYVYRRIGRICNIFRHLLLRFFFFKSRLLLPLYFRSIVFTQFFKLASFLSHDRIFYMRDFAAPYLESEFL